MSEQRFDFTKVMRRLSTWLGLASASATSGLAAYALLNEAAQAAFPQWALAGMGLVAVVSAILIPVATSFRQKGLP
ncbi:hypothetical protein [Marilutibacter spongiae]|uniref:Uncharacterized protein n=1 Tax=Marilutibacter spongiae TaxID=2025720 RepID=A0A7W3TLW2_9GAMM|nr:hypothetical protein [Lysobacter spongiae]MBB1060409.1 hypothetical protein [Lysobacter spongiae]